MTCSSLSLSISSSTMTAAFLLTNELMDEIAKILNKKAAVIVLDEIDKLKEEQVIYQLVEDISKKCIIMITNEKDFLAILDQRRRHSNRSLSLKRSRECCRK